MSGHCRSYRQHAPTVENALKRFLPEFLAQDPPLSADQQRAIWAINHCRTEAMGGARYVCGSCNKEHFAWHSCNHRACPRCGKSATAEWVKRQLERRINAPYFFVTFTLPSDLRSLFFGPFAKDAFDLFFKAVSGALSEKLAEAKGLKAEVNGFTAVLHTWGKQMQFHPHIHCLVPGAGINAKGKVVTVKKENFLVHVPKLKAAYKEHFLRLLEAGKWGIDPAARHCEWNVHIQAAGNGSQTVKYLGAYVGKSVISDSRIVSLDRESVTIEWKDRDHGDAKRTTRLSGVEFVRRYLRHVLPPGLRSIRYFGYCHPASKRNRERVRLHTGCVIYLDGCDAAAAADSADATPRCRLCGVAMLMVEKIIAVRPKRGPPGQLSLEMGTLC